MENGIDGSESRMRGDARKDRNELIFGAQEDLYATEPARIPVMVADGTNSDARKRIEEAAALALVREKLANINQG